MATRQAYQRAKSSGQTVVVSRDGMIIAELADRTERILGLCKPRRKVKAGIAHLLGGEAPKDAGA
jgi:apolipoprotein N-acyltransferase|tara:strand:- start:21 stop:215 length:195 start_codon:yes stop_codon:yes gene_type:complete